MKKFKPGISFGDFVIRDVSASKSKIPQEKPSDFRRGWLVWLLVLSGMMLVVVRLAALQVISGSRYRLLADENRIRRIKLIAPRGRILDRRGEELAGNVRIEAPKAGQTVMFWQRKYPIGAAGAHVIGYLGEVMGEEVGLFKDRGEKYEVGEVIGRSGVETEYETELRGQDGGVLVEVDNHGRAVRELGVAQPVAGRDLRLTIDLDVQKTAYEAFRVGLPASAALAADSGRAKKGAVVVTVPDTGEILALVSSPSYDPDTLSDQYAVLSTRDDLPLFNRAVGGAYPPGSTFKMVTTAAAIGSGSVQPNFTYLDQGVIRVGTFSYYNWLFGRGGGTEGIIGFVRAITRSTDTFFYRVGELTGPEEIALWAREFGFGQKTGVDLPGEVEGVIPDPEWKEEVKGEKWFLGDTFIMAIGQGDILVTPLQLNQMTNVLATGGKKCRPHLTQTPNPKHQIPSDDQCPNVQIPKEVLEIIKKGMVGACSPGGTAFPLFDWNEGALMGLPHSAFTKAPLGVTSLPLVACKTGTAEYVAEDGKMRTHGWLTAYAPAEAPEISVTAVVEGGGEGSSVAAPIVRKVMAKYFGIVDTYPYGSIRNEVSE